MSLIRVQNLTFTYEGSAHPVFEGVSFQIDTDWKLGFTGRNGRGKTTFLNLLMKKYEYGGAILSDVAFEYFPYRVPDESRTCGELMQTLCPQAQDWEVAREMTLLDMDEGALYRPFETLSRGERTKLLLCAMFLKENSFLLIDEPTNHLDTQARGKLSAYLKRKKGFILVSHDRAFLDGCIDHILSINKTDIEVQRGNFSSWMQNRDFAEAYERGQNEKLEKDIRRLKRVERRTAGWADEVEKTKKGTRTAGLKPDRGHVGHMAAKMMKRSKAVQARRQNAIEEKAGLLQNVEQADALKLCPLRHHAGCLARLSGVSFGYTGKTVLRDFSLEVGQGERIALCGKNGSGKTSVLGLLNGALKPSVGEAKMAGGLQISYVPQDTSFLKGDLQAYATERAIDRSLFMAILRKLDFSRAQFEKDIGEFSEGQKKKVLIAGSLCESAHLYIWDEPLNYMDVLSRMQVEKLLVDFKPTMVFVEHDRAFVDAVATRVVRMPEDAV